MTDEDERIERITTLANEAWPGVEHLRVSSLEDGGAMITKDAYGDIARLRHCLALIEHPRALEMLNAALVAAKPSRLEELSADMEEWAELDPERQRARHDAGLDDEPSAESLEAIPEISPDAVDFGRGAEGRRNARAHAARERAWAYELVEREITEARIAWFPPTLSGMATADRERMGGSLKECVDVIRSARDCFGRKLVP